MVRSLGIGLMFALSVGGCRCERSAEDEPRSEPAPTSSAPAPLPLGAGRPSRDAGLDLLAELDSCTVRHRGLSIDLGTPLAHSLRGFAVEPPDPASQIEREGATFARLSARKSRFDFWLDSARTEDLFVSVRVHALLARRMAAFLDDRSLGSVRLTPGTTETLTFPTTHFELAKGRHVLTLRFTDRSSGGPSPLADVDWIRIGIADELAATYAAPTLRDIVTSLEIDGRPRQSLVLRAPSSLRCPLVVTEAARLKVSLGFWGTGKGTAEIRLVRDGEPTLSLLQRKVIGGEGSRWLPVEVDLGRFAGEVIGLELRAVDATGGGRLVFGEPSLVSGAAPTAKTPTTDTVVLGLLSSLDRRRTPPWGAIGELTVLGELAHVGVAFGHYRVPTTIPAGVFASLLSGLPPRSHALEDPAARLPDAVHTIPELLKTAGGHTAFFSGVPTAFGAFGFGAGWDRFETFSPVADIAASEPWEQGAKWLDASPESSRKRLLVVATRGMHPPWDLSRDDVGRLPPEEYGGALDARRGGVTLGNIRTQKQAQARRLMDEEWTRLRAMEDAALSKQVQAIGRLIETLKRNGAWDRCLFVVTTDVALGDPPRVPYDPAGPLSEDRLLAPLLVKFPGGALGGEERDVAVASIDVARTLLEALGLRVPAHMEGRDLLTLAAGEQGPALQPNVATLGSTFATRIGGYLLTGEHGKVPRLCQLSVDPACVTDLFAQRPIAAEALWRWTYRAETRSRSPRYRTADREPASIDPDTAAALIVWGDVR